MSRNTSFAAKNLEIRAFHHSLMKKCLLVQIGMAMVNSWLKLQLIYLKGKKRWGGC